MVTDTPGGVNINISNGVVNLVISEGDVAVLWVSSCLSRTACTG